MTSRLLASLFAVIAMALGAPLARAQSVIGTLDVVDQQSVFGWSCFPGNPNAKVPIELWAIDVSTGGWAYIGATTADKQRVDVGNAGVCGSGPESYYHGFEWPIYPNNILGKNKSYTVYAYYRPTGQFLNLSGRVLSFPESSLPTSGYWRTDLDDPNARMPSLVSCVWPFPGANQRGNFNDDPLWIVPGAGGTWRFGTPLEYSTPSNWCINYNPAAVAAPWAQSNSATNAPFWPTSNYWVVHANVEPAYSQKNSGPPGQSLPINTGGVFSIASNGSSFTLGADNTKRPANVNGAPFLSFGTQMGRGTAGPLAVFDPNGPETYLRFNATKNIDQNFFHPYHMMTVFIEAMWGGTTQEPGAKRWLWITLQQQTTARVHWNWNAYPSFFYPGAEINLISIDDLAGRCGINIGTKMDNVPPGVTQSYNIPIGAAFRCADSILGWSAQRPAWTPLFISGVHLGIETPDGNSTNVLNVTYSLPQLVR